MDCHSVRENLNAFIDGELSEIEERLVSAHLEACPSCRHEREAYSAVRDLTTRFGPVQSPGDLSESIRILMEKERLLPKKKSAAAFRPRFNPRRFALAASVVFVILIAAASGSYMYRGIQSAKKQAGSPMAAKMEKTSAEQASGKSADKAGAEAKVRQQETPAEPPETLALNTQTPSADEAETAIAPETDASPADETGSTTNDALAALGMPSEKQTAAPPVRRARSAAQRGKAPAKSTSPRGKPVLYVKLPPYALPQIPGSTAGTVNIASISGDYIINDFKDFVNREGFFSSGPSNKVNFPIGNVALASTGKADTVVTGTAMASAGYEADRTAIESAPADAFSLADKAINYSLSYDKSKDLEVAERFEANTQIMNSLQQNIQNAPAAPAAAAPSGGALAKTKSAPAAEMAKSSKPAKPSLKMTLKARSKNPDEARRIALEQIKAAGGTAEVKNGRIIITLPPGQTLDSLNRIKAGTTGQAKITVPEKLLNNEARDDNPRTVTTEIQFVGEDE